jgi:hypothetical protein
LLQPRGGQYERDRVTDRTLGKSEHNACKHGRLSTVDGFSDAASTAYALYQMLLLHCLLLYRTCRGTKGTTNVNYSCDFHRSG